MKEKLKSFFKKFELNFKVPVLIVSIFGLVHLMYGVIMLSESIVYGVLWLCFGFVELAIVSFGLTLQKTRPSLAKILLVACSIWLCFQTALDAGILAAGISFDTSKADKVIVLGYQLKNDMASDTLLRRVEKAYEYAKENPECKLIVTGGVTGKNTKSEAEVMKNALVSYGVDSLRIYKEDQAKNTIDNMKLCKEFLSSKDKVVLITSNYHCLRAKVLADRMGYSVKTVGASAPLKLMLNQLFLEKAALLKIFVFGV